MAAYRRVHDSCHLQADCQEPGSAPEPYARQSSMRYLYLNRVHTARRTRRGSSVASVWWCELGTGDESVPKIVINNTMNLLLKTAIGILVISNHNSYRVLFDKIAPVYFI